jgi:hypothetical protein
MAEPEVVAVVVHSDSPFASELTQLSPKQAVRTKGFDGVDLLTVLIPLSAAAIAAIVKIVTKSIEAKKYITIKHQGIEIRGISEDKLITVLNQLITNPPSKSSKKKD